MMLDLVALMQLSARFAMEFPRVSPKFILGTNHCLGVKVDNHVDQSRAESGGTHFKTFSYEQIDVM